MSADELARAARELIDSVSERIKYPADKPFIEMVLVPANLLDFLREALEPLPESTPYVVVNPRMRHGEPSLRGHRLSAAMIADRYWEWGEHLETELLANYEITRADVLACCFYVANYGTRKQRARWKDWLAAVWANTGQDRETLVNSGWWSDDWSDVPLPPTRQHEAAS